jgi:hypothetical protein
LEVPIPFFFEGLPSNKSTKDDTAFRSRLSQFLATSDGLSLVKAYTQIKRAELRRAVVRLVEKLSEA